MMSEEGNYDFIVGFTIFMKLGYKTMHRHFSSLERAQRFANNVNIKDNHKIYVDYDLYQKEKEKNKELGKGQASLMASRKKWKERYYKERAKNKKLELETIPLLEGEVNAYREGEKYSAKQLKNFESSKNKYYIHKDKIRGLLEKYDKDIAWNSADDHYYFTKFIQELLGGNAKNE